MAALFAAGLAAVGGGVGTSPALAQTTPTPPTPAPATSVPKPRATAGAPTTTTPEGCTAPLKLAAVFVGRVTRADTQKVTFVVTKVAKGKVAKPVVTVDYGDTDDARFLDVGSSYLVAVDVDPESAQFESKVRRPRGQDAKCARTDPIYTKRANGAAIDTAVLAGMRGNWGKVGLAFLIPAAIVLAVLLALVLVKYVVLLIASELAYQRRRRRQRRASRPPGPPPPVPVPRPVRRTRTRTAPPAPG